MRAMGWRDVKVGRGRNDYKKDWVEAKEYKVIKLPRHEPLEPQKGSGWTDQWT